MLPRILTACKKFIFCYRVTATRASFFKLLANTKRWRWYKDQPGPAAKEEAPVRYALRLDGNKQDIFLRTYTGDLDIFYEIFWLRTYALSQTTINDLRLIVDVGSNIGLSVLYFLFQSPGAKIIGVEPEAGNYALLLENCREAIDRGRVSTLQAAVSNTDGDVSLTVADIKYNTRVTDFKTDNPVQGISMDSLFKKYGIARADLVKIDIEGSERNIFSGDTSWLNHVQRLLIEFHDDASREFCFGVLKQYHFLVSGPVANGFTQSVFFAERAS